MCSLPQLGKETAFRTLALQDSYSFIQESSFLPRPAQGTRKVTAETTLTSVEGRHSAPSVEASHPRFAVLTLDSACVRSLAQLPDMQKSSGGQGSILGHQFYVSSIFLLANLQRVGDVHPLIGQLILSILS